MSAIEQQYWGNAFMPNTMATYRDEVAQCVKRLGTALEHDQTLIVQREGGAVVPKLVDAKEIDLDNLLQYEMILFEGAAANGAMWKHVFFPTHLRDCFIGASPVMAIADEVDAEEATPSASGSSHQSSCDDCGAVADEIIGCPDGAEICQDCFDAGRH